MDKEALFSLIQDGFYNNIYIVGYTGSGKSTLANEISDLDGTHVIYFPHSVGQYFKSLVAPATPDYTQAVTNKSLEILAKDPDFVIKYYKSKGNCHGGGVIVDGLRNPRDFIHLFDHNSDLVVFLDREGLEAKTEFETGVDVIKEYVGWLNSNFVTENVFSVTVSLPSFNPGYGV